MKISKKGFTLIELIIVISIIVLMAAVSIPAYQNYGARSELALKADEIKALIDRAEAYSRNPAQGQNCAHVIFSEKVINIQFGSMDTSIIPTPDGCTVGSEHLGDISSKNTIDRPTYMQFVYGTSGKLLSRFVGYYPGKVKLNSGYLVNKITITSDKFTSKQAVITINTDPYSSKIEIINK